MSCRSKLNFKGLKRKLPNSSDAGERGRISRGRQTSLSKYFRSTTKTESKDRTDEIVTNDAKGGECSQKQHMEFSPKQNLISSVTKKLQNFVCDASHDCLALATVDEMKAHHDSEVICDQPDSMGVTNGGETKKRSLSACASSSQEIVPLSFHTATVSNVVLSAEHYRWKPNKTEHVKYTPLEQQFVDIKLRHEDAVLLVECGYKYRFFGRDAEVAAKELNIMCHPNHSFMTASIPAHRLHVHVRRLVANGYKVGVVKQIETTALKAAGDNKNKVFERKLAALYTKSTLVGEDLDPMRLMEDDDDDFAYQEADVGSLSSYLMTVTEVLNANSRTAEIGILAVCPSTGEIIYDHFTDGKARLELENRFAHIQPTELLLSSVGLSVESESLLTYLASVSYSKDDRTRIERAREDWFSYSHAIRHLSVIYENAEVGFLNFSKILDLPPLVVCCLSATISYLEEFNLQDIIKFATEMTHFSTDSEFVKLPAQTIRNLDLFLSQSNNTQKGSLMWLIDHTQTKFGSRLLMKWVSQPLQDVGRLKLRQDAVTELSCGNGSVIPALKAMLGKVPDLEKGLGDVFHKKCSTVKFLSVMKALSEIAITLQSLSIQIASTLKSEILKELLQETGDHLKNVNVWLQNINIEAAKLGDKTALFKDTSLYPRVAQIQKDIEDITLKLHDERVVMRKLLLLPTLEYVTVSGIEYLVEIKKTAVRQVPKDWIEINATQRVSRFRSPRVQELYLKLCLLREQLLRESSEAWMLFLEEFRHCYHRYHKAVVNLAELDCYFSLATVAQFEGYCRPVLNDSKSEIHIEGGRHPVVSQMMHDGIQYVPNDTHLEGDRNRCMIITGPNMGGKSSYLRQVAVITVLAHIGSYVPATSASIGIIDGIYSRMGAYDDILLGRSTFMTELQETSEILKQATSRSLVILDELGRGTSTHDGAAIAYATLDHVVNKIGCFILFVTHYPLLSELETKYPELVNNFHVGFDVYSTEEQEQPEKMQPVIFLYELVVGKATSSFGLNVARLAGLPQEILTVAATKSEQLEIETLQRRSSKQLVARLMQTNLDVAVEDLTTENSKLLQQLFAAT